MSALGTQGRGSDILSLAYQKMVRPGACWAIDPHSLLQGSRGRVDKVGIDVM